MILLIVVEMDEEAPGEGVVWLDELPPPFVD